jgi:hypothetical protein
MELRLRVEMGASVLILAATQRVKEFRATTIRLLAFEAIGWNLALFFIEDFRYNPRSQNRERRCPNNPPSPL